MAFAFQFGRATRLVGMAVLGALVLTSCGPGKDKRMLFDGFYFKTKSKRIGDDYRNFIVTADKAYQSLEGARQAAEYEGTRYCLDNAMGTSRIRWTVGPETPDNQLTFDGDTLIYQGECNP